MPSEIWAKRFAYIAVINLFIGTVWTGLFTFGGSYGLPDWAFGRIITGGSSATYFNMAYLLFLIAGVLGPVAFTTLYYLIPKMTGADSTIEWLSWLNFILSNAGTWIGCLVLGYWGYKAGYMQHVAQLETSEIHNWLTQIVEPMGIFILITSLGMLIGAINLALAIRKKS